MVEGLQVSRSPRHGGLSKTHTKHLGRPGAATRTHLEVLQKNPGNILEPPTGCFSWI